MKIRQTRNVIVSELKETVANAIVILLSASGLDAEVKEHYKDFSVTIHDVDEYDATKATKVVKAFIAAISAVDAAPKADVA